MVYFSSGWYLSLSVFLYCRKYISEYIKYVNVQQGFLQQGKNPPQAEKNIKKNIMCNKAFCNKAFCNKTMHEMPLQQGFLQQGFLS